MTLLEDYGDWSTEQTMKAHKCLQDNEYLKRTLNGLVLEHNDLDIGIEMFLEIVDKSAEWVEETERTFLEELIWIFTNHKQSEYVEYKEVELFLAGYMYDKLTDLVNALTEFKDYLVATGKEPIPVPMFMESILQELDGIDSFLPTSTQEPQFIVAGSSKLFDVFNHDATNMADIIVSMNLHK